MRVPSLPSTAADPRVSATAPGVRRTSEAPSTRTRPFAVGMSSVVPSLPRKTEPSATRLEPTAKVTNASASGVLTLAAAPRTSTSRRTAFSGAPISVDGGATGSVTSGARGALLVLGLVAVAGFSVLSRAFDVLADRAPLERAAIEASVRAVTGVRAVRSVRSRGAPGDIHVDLTIEVDRQISVEAAHAIADSVEEIVKTRFAGANDVLVHVEPNQL